MDNLNSFPTCRYCGSAKVLADAYARWDNDGWRFDLENAYPENGFCEECEQECGSLQWETPSGGGRRISRYEAEQLIEDEPYRQDIMCFDYGKDNCDECEGACICWNGITIDDFNEEGHLDDDYVNFEQWSDEVGREEEDEK